MVGPVALILDGPEGDDGKDGQPPLDPDEKAGLIPRHIDTQGALNDWEQENILQASKWLRRAKVPEVLSEGFSGICIAGGSTKPGTGRARFERLTKISDAIGRWSW